jgi:Ca2+-binding RTX toxin-like protein
MRRFTAQLVVGLTATSSVVWAALVVHAVPTCFGKPATLVGTDQGTAGDDVMVLPKANGFVDGGTGKDRICVGRGNADVAGGPGHDLIRGGKGWDTLNGGPGRDLLDAGQGGDDLEGGAGNDRLLGGDGRDQLSGERGNDTARGGPGADTLFHSRGDILGGGKGSDTVSGFGRSGARVDLGAGIAREHGRSILRSIENARGWDGNDVLIGSGKPNLFIPVYGDDRIDGRGGRDVVFFDRFEDFIETGVTIDLTTGTGTGAGSDTMSGIEDVIGSEGPDVIRGDAGPNRLFGFYDDDELHGLDGNDVLDGDVRRGRAKGERGDSADGGAGVDACRDVEQRISCESSRYPVSLLRLLSDVLTEPRR